MVRFYGIATVQYYNYHHRFDRDHVFLKSLVRCIFVNLLTVDLIRLLDLHLMVRIRSSFFTYGIVRSSSARRIQNTLGLILYLVTTYWYNVTNFLNPLALLLPHW